MTHPRSDEPAFVRALAPTLVLGWLALLSGCSEPRPSYPMTSVDLRLIPELSVVATAASSVFVTVEVGATALTLDGGPAYRTVHVRAENATLTPLPGPLLCANNDVGSTPDASAPGAGSAAVHVVDLPWAALEATNGRGVHETGLVINVPAGRDDVLLTASVFTAASATDCETPDGRLEAEAFLRLQRKLTELDSSVASDDGAAGDVTENDAGDLGDDQDRDVDGGAAGDAGVPDVASNEVHE